MTRQQLDVQVKNGGLVRVWYGVYAAAEPDLLGRLAALDLFVGRHVVACMGTAARLYGFDVENSTAIHVLDPAVRMRPTTRLMVHQRTGAELRHVAGRLATAPAWTAIEVARELPRPRALATLDAALRSGWTTQRELERAVHEQRGRRGIVAVRGLLPYADARVGNGKRSTPCDDRLQVATSRTAVRDSGSKRRDMACGLCVAGGAGRGGIRKR